MKGAIKLFGVLLVLVGGGGEADEWPSATLAERYAARPSDFFPGPITMPDRRELLLSRTWNLASQMSNVDNRQYLFALAIDLYNTLPPGSVYDEGMLQGGKSYWYMQIHGLLFPVGMAYEEFWRSIGNGETDLNLAQGYILYYLRENAHLDSYSVTEASLDPARLDLKNPTHYQQLRRWMAETVTAREQGLPPWEAIKQFPAEPDRPARSATAATSDTIAATAATTDPSELPLVTQPQPMPAPDDYDSAPTGNTAARPWWIAVAVVISLFAVTWLLRRRKVG